MYNPEVINVHACIYWYVCGGVVCGSGKTNYKRVFFGDFLADSHFHLVHFHLSTCSGVHIHVCVCRGTRGGGGILTSVATSHDLSVRWPSLGSTFLGCRKFLAEVD